MKIPQYFEQNLSHFRVKVDAERVPDDDIWFELVNEDNSSKTYTNADFDQLLPIESPIVNPTRLRIYMKPATSGATLGGTAITAVYWGTNDPKSLWSGTHKIVKDSWFSTSLKSLSFRGTPLAPHLGASSNYTAPSLTGFRLVRRPVN